MWQTVCPNGTIDHCYHLENSVNDNEDFAIIEHYKVDGIKHELSIIDYKKFELLKKLHVNIYDLPKEMYIEKQTLNK